MPRFHFDLIDSKTVVDYGGRLLEDEELATEVAIKLAQELFDARPELRGKGFKILVTDADGERVHEAPLDRFRLV
jgi:hypothetical protein